MSAGSTPYHVAVIRAEIIRTLAGLCALLWVAGSVSAAYGSLTPQWTIPHCPQGTSHQAQHSQNHCVWHCDGIDAQAATGRSPGGSVDPAGYVSNVGGRFLQTITYRKGTIPRGPPAIRPF